MRRILACLLTTFTFAAQTDAVADPAESFRSDELETLTVEQAREIVATHKGTLSFRELPEVSLEVAKILATYKGEVRLNGLKRLTPEVAEILSRQPKAANLFLNGLTEITPEVARALAVRNGGMLSLDALTELSPEVARELANVKAKLALGGVTHLSVESARELTKHPSKLTLFSVSTLSEEAADAIAEHRSTLLLHGLTHLSSPKLAGKMLKSNDGFVSFKKARTMTEEVARVFAAYDGRKAMSLAGLVELPEAVATQLRENEKLILPTHLRKPGVTNSLGMRLAYIPAGKFGMGSPRDESGRKDEERRHEVRLSREFYLGVHEVTVGQFRTFVRESGYKTDSDKDGKGSWGIAPNGKFERDAKYDWKSPGFEQSDDHPVIDVSWNDAKAFCKWLSAKEGKTYRLPTEAEWEYACRAGTRTAYSFGDDPQDLSKAGNAADASARSQFGAWSLGIKGDDGHAYTAPVGQFAPNRFGLYDMHGNVWEWCEDWYAEDAYQRSARTDPTGPETGTMRVHRGGGWSSAPDRCRSASRIRRHPSEYRGCYLGFRVVQEILGSFLIDLTDRTQIEKRRPLLIAHRGGVIRVDAPECSLAAISLADEAGYAMVELDIQRSRDDVPIVFHDQTLKEACGVEGRVNEKTAADLVKIRYTGSTQRIVGLDAALSLCRELNLGVMLDLKAGRDDEQFLRKIDAMIVAHELGKAAVTITGTQSVREELRHVLFTPSKEQMARFRKGEEVDLRGTFWFGLPDRLLDAEVGRLQKSGALVLPAINTFRYPGDRHMELARKDIDRLVAAGVDGFQIDSVYAGSVKK